MFSVLKNQSSITQLLILGVSSLGWALLGGSSGLGGAYLFICDHLLGLLGQGQEFLRWNQMGKFVSTLHGPLSSSRQCVFIQLQSKGFPKREWKQVRTPHTQAQILHTDAFGTCIYLFLLFIFCQSKSQTSLFKGWQNSLTPPLFFSQLYWDIINKCI